MSNSMPSHLWPVGQPFDICSAFNRLLQDEQVSTPLAAILALVELMEKSSAGTMFELVKELKASAENLKKQLSNYISLNAGCELFTESVTLFPHDTSSFSELKTELIRQGHQYIIQVLTYHAKIAELAFDFIKDDSVILTHLYSRVAHKRKRISVFITEARPQKLTAARIPTTAILDSAVAYWMDMVDFVLVDSEAVVESGGLINAVGSNQIAIIAKTANKPFYALAESYKFRRLFILSQYDLSSHTPNLLSFSLPIGRPLHKSSINPSPKSSFASGGSTWIKISEEQLTRNNSSVDYTRPDLISLVFSDVGSLTPEGVSQYLVGMFAG
ncbi:uncharacterized protein EV420DRAFT_1623782 [Desarmillaria tabescens]|uniref:Translation initiation factor eIF2B subunit alpha n=1 Tax=Armillaria tabescens TaxID=1929756 RepID=A0AA39J1T0_ARMTA|nr:uncharacterized protein EV420DRAFT_1623782 [Desarmillaria tabescens]KAK0434528.1 hypothetical protein EV420DRAFT_1623782 [Desarmillaria tabescens]